MAIPRLSDNLLKLGFGQHILNGLSVALGVAGVTIVTSLLFGFESGMAASSGAICVSAGDLPNPLASKLKILPLALVLACLSSVAIAFTTGHPISQFVVVVSVSALAGLLVGFGRWALPVSVLTLLALVLTLGAPMHGLQDELRHEGLFVFGGTGYMLVAFATTRLTERGGRRIAVAECLREFAAYLRAIADFYDAGKDLPAVYRRVVEQQAALADHLQSARQLVFLGRRNPSAKRLAASIVLQLDMLDTVVSTHADYAPLRRGDVGPLFPALVGQLARDLADDIDGLAGDLLRRRRILALPGRFALLDRLSAEVTRLRDMEDLDPRSLRAARATRTKFAWVTEHLSRLPKALQDDEAAERLLRGIDLAAFLQPLSFSPHLLRRHFTLTSPVMRHALRLSAAMGAGYLLVALVPYLNHGNWILLTIAVILRAQYGVTRRRRNDRLLGNLIGCLIAALLLKATPATVQLAVIPLAVGVSHAYARVNYLLTSVAACVMAILSLHFLDPIQAPPILDRLLDTVIGAAIAFLFSRLLPRWEYQEAPQLVARMMKSFRSYMGDALRRDIGEQSYRLARKAMMESFAAITESATHMAGEPAHAQAAMPQLAAIVSAAYNLAAQIVGIRVLLRHRSKEIAPAFAEDLLHRTRAIVLGQLDLTQDFPETGGLEAHDEQTIDAEKALQIRCSELCAAAAALHEVAAAQKGG